VHRPFNADDVGQKFVCIHAKSAGDQYIEASARLVEGKFYRLIAVRQGQGVFEGATCWGQACSWAADRFEPVPR
jgi:hypothetical protein